jgi:hypothetical protein
MPAMPSPTALTALTARTGFIVCTLALLAG